MASIFAITASTGNANYLATKAAFESMGHAVTGAVATTTTTGLDTAWSGGTFDVILLVRMTQGTPHVATSWASAKWAAGTPILVGGPEAAATTSATEHCAEHLGLISSMEQYTTGSTDAFRAQGTHPITEQFSSGDLLTVTSATSYVRDTAHSLGTELGDSWSGSSDLGTMMSAFDVGDAINGSASAAPGSTAPARAVFCGFILAGAYTADGLDLMNQTVAWLTNSNVVVRSISVSAVAALGTTAFVDVPATASGDVVLVIEADTSSADEITSISGLGATWTEVTTAVDGGIFSVWKGVGATPSGSSRTVTATGTSISSPNRRILTAFVLPNADDRIAAAASASSPDDNPQQSPVMTPNAYDRVIAMGYSDDASFAIDSTSPSSGVTVSSALTIATSRFAKYAYWAPTTADGTSHSITNHRIGGGARSVIVRIRPFVPSRTSDGSTFTRALAVHTSNGSTWTGAKAVHTSNGSAWS